MLTLHPSITEDRILAAVTRRNTSLDDPGFCTACGIDADHCEPDAECYPCESCGERAVYGAEQLMFMTVA